MEKIKQELAEMVRIDQEARKAVKVNWDEVTQIDAANTLRLKQIITEFGWPSISEFGPEAAHDAWLLVQHADKDPEFQEYCLELMKSLPEGEVSKRDIAFLTDRVMIKREGKQKYGTQRFGSDGYQVVMPLIDKDRLDEFRAEVGMEPMAEFIANYHIKVLLEDPDSVELKIIPRKVN